MEGMPQGSSALVATREALTREGLHIDIPKMEYEEAIGLFKEKDGHFENEKPGLFISAARRATNNNQWGKRLSNADMDVLKEIDQILDGHPLGIKLAAALVASDSLESIREKLRAAPPREVSDRFDFSYDTLGDSQKKLLHRMAAFSGSVEVWAIEAISSEYVFGDNRIEQLQQWRNDLSELVRKSFVDIIEQYESCDQVDGIEKPRYHLHPLMRQYAEIKAGDIAMELHHNHAANLFLEYAEKYSNDHDALEAEHENLLAGADWAYTAKKWELIKRLVNAIEAYLDQRGYWSEERLLLERAVEAAEKLVVSPLCVVPFRNY